MPINNAPIIIDGERRDTWDITGEGYYDTSDVLIYNPGYYR